MSVYECDNEIYEHVRVRMRNQIFIPFKDVEIIKVPIAAN